MCGGAVGSPRFDGQRLDHRPRRRSAHECGHGRATQRTQSVGRRHCPSYGRQKHFCAAENRGRLRHVASPDGAEGSVLLHQDVRIYAGLFDAVERQALVPGEQRPAYVYLARGALCVNGTALEAGASWSGGRLLAAAGCSAALPPTRGEIA